DVVRARLLRQLLDPAASERYTEQVQLHGRGTRRGEVDEAAAFVHAQHGCDVPVAFGKLPLHAAVAAVDVQVVPAVALARPEEALAVMEPDQVVIDVDPGTVRLDE